LDKLLSLDARRSMYSIMPPGTLLVHDPCTQELAHFLGSLIISCLIQHENLKFLHIRITDQLLPDV
jgi:hypothetical protein